MCSWGIGLPIIHRSSPQAHDALAIAPVVQDMRSRRLRQIQREDGDAEEPQASSEDHERETWLKQIALASLKAADRLHSINQVWTCSETRSACLPELAGLLVR